MYIMLNIQVVAQLGYPGRISYSAAVTRRSLRCHFNARPHIHMAKADTKTSIDSDGLRYRSKTPGSPFTAAGAFGAATMSCFLCGKHRPRSQLKSRRLLGKAQFVCSPTCKEADAEGGAKP